MSYLSDLGTFLKGEREGVTLELDNKLNAIAPYSGYLAVAKKLDNFYFQTNSNFIASMADKNRYVKFLDKVVDTWSNTVQTTSTQTANATATTLTMSNTTGLTVGKVIAILKGDLLVHTSVITAVSTNVSITVLNSFNREVTAYKIKIIQSINLNDYVPDVLVQDEATNGLTLQTSVNAGDYVVVNRKELVTNGTFDTDTSGWTAQNSTLSVVSNRLRVTALGTGAISAYQNIPRETGVKYVLSFEVLEGNTTATVEVRGNPTVTYNNLTTGKYTYVITGGTDDLIFFRPTSTANGSYVDFDNISVRQLDETYRAKINAPAGTLLTNTTYFEVRDSIGVTNQIGVFHRYNTLTNSYEGLSAEILFSDVSKEDLLDNPTWLARNGFSKVGEYCYSKGVYLYLPVSIWQSLNKGAYHQVLNRFGAKHYKLTGIADKQWYDTPMTSEVNNLSKAFKYNNGTYAIQDITGYVSINKTGHPQGKFYDIIYPDQIIDTREYAKRLNKWEVDLIRADKEENGVSETTFIEKVTQTTTGTVATLEVGNGANYRLGSVLQIWNGTTPYGRYVVSISGDTVTLDSTIVKTAVPFIISGGKLSSLGSDTSLKARLLGTPINFPTVMTSRLTESKYIIGLDLQMVDDSGNNQLFDGVKDSFKLGDKFTSILQTLRSTNSGSTYTSFAATNNTITNALTLTDEPTANIVLVSMTAKNVPYVQKLTADYEIIWEDDYVYVSNNYDISKKIPVLINNVTGKVSAGTDSVEQLAITKIMNDLIYQTAKTATVDATIRKFIAVKNNVFYAGLRYDVGNTASIDLTDNYVYILPLGCRR